VIGYSTLNGGVATLITDKLLTGQHTLSATYHGDSNFLASSSSSPTDTTPHVVSVSDFTLSSDSAGQIVQTGDSSVFKMTATPINGTYDEVITFSASGLPKGATATFDPASLTPGGKPATVTLTIKTATQLALDRMRSAAQYCWDCYCRSLVYVADAAPCNATACF